MRFVANSVISIVVKMKNHSEIDKNADILANQKEFKEANIDLKLNVLESLKAKIEYILSSIVKR